MLTEEDINFFRKNGYIIKKSSNIENIKHFKNIALNQAKKKLKISKNKIKLEKLHKFINLRELNNFRINVYNEFNKNKNISKLFYNSVKDVLDDLVGNELMMQKKINISFQFPKDLSSNLPMHSDVIGDESPFEVVVWIPLVDVQPNSSSLFIVNPKNNKSIMSQVINTKKNSIEEIYKKNIKKFKFLKVTFGEVLYFSPILLHGNTLNISKFSRISLNCRFKSLLSPTEIIKKSTKNIPNFYKPINVKPMTKIGFNFLNKLDKNYYKK